MVNIQPVHVLQIVGEPLGGIRKHIHDILWRVDPNVVRFSYVYSTNEQDAIFKAELPDLSKRLVKILPLPISKLPTHRDLLNIIFLARFIRQNHVDVIHGHGAKGGLYARILTLLTQSKAIYTPHGGSLHGMFSTFSTLLYIGVEKLMLPLSDCLVFESNYTADVYLRKIGTPKIRYLVNYNGVARPDLESINKEAKLLDFGSISNTHFKICVVGVLRKVKGQHIAIQALSLLHQSGRKACLHLFGKGPDLDKLKTLAEDLDLKEWVIFHGDVANPLPYMVAMDIVLIPSLFESFGYVALEANFLGKWTIASNTGGLKEVVQEGKTGNLFLTGDPKALSETIERAWDGGFHPSPDETKDMMKRFDISRMVSCITKIYQELA